MLVTPENVARVLRLLDSASDLTIDLETTGLFPWQGDVMVGVAVQAVNLTGTGNGETFYLPFRHEHPGNLGDVALNDLLRIFEGKALHTGFNYKFDLHFLLREGMRLPPRINDPMLAAFLVNENEPSIALKALGDKYIGEGSSAEQKALDDLLKENKLKKNEMGKLPPEFIAPYAEQDVRLTTALREFYRPKLATWSLTDLAEEVYEYERIITKMEARGIAIDRERVIQYRDECTEEQAKAAETLRLAAGLPNLNLRSAPQLQRLLSLPSTAAEFLEDQKHRNLLDARQLDLVEKLQDFRMWERARSAYYEPYLEFADQNDVLHPSYNLARVITTRLSCNSPNLMAIPRHDERAVGKVKEVFISRPGFTFANADYSQAELRLLAHYIQDERMIELFIAGGDFHQSTADDFRIPRDIAKRINFGIVYGLGEKGLSERTYMTRAEAREHLNKYHRGRPGVRQLMNKGEATAKQRGYIRLWTGRVSHFNTKFRDPHLAMSYLIQGGVAEVLRVKITELDKGLERFGAHMLIQVHDSIMFEIPDENLDETIEYVRNALPELPFDCPFAVDVEVGKRWGSAKKIKAGETWKNQPVAV